MTHPSEPAPERGEVEALILKLNEWVADFPHDRGTTYSVMHPVTLMVEAATTIASLSAEVERLRAAATPPAPAIIVERSTACLHQHVGKSATMLCVAPGDHDGWHVYHRIENVSVIEQEGEGHGPRS